ncbi:MAG: hypothetical protein MI861_01430, partial [Pirellulales bacterium]|nr:hypothetical protein [Pirellulales bacterium]
DVETRNRYVARRLAQWAVNAVDFRDTNCAMTRFRFDEDPFDADGWDTSGGFQTVWGAEPSDLMLTEGLATHDKRTRDTTLDQGEADMPPMSEQKSRNISDPMDTPDADMDQMRIPLASAYVEIQNVRPFDNNITEHLHYPAELYDFSTNPPSLDLSRLVADPSTGAQYPIWRLAVSEGVSGADPDRTLKSPRWLADGERLSNNMDDPFAGESFNRFAEEHRHLASFQVGPEGLLPFGPDQQTLTIDRVVWFAGLDPRSTTLPADAPDINQVFFNAQAAATPPRLLPGQYAVVGPRLLTNFGQNTTCTEGNSFEYDPSDQQLEILQDANGDWEVHYTDLNDMDHTPEYPSDSSGGFRIRGVVPIIARSLPPHLVQGGLTDWIDYFNTVTSGAPNERVDFGFNISAPLTGADYYPAPAYKLNTGAGTEFPLFDSYYDATAATGAPLDQPVDEIAGSNKPLLENGWLAGGTHQDAKTVFLQRLADPSQPYDPTSNPYISVDWLTLDLHVFSGHQDLDDTVDANGNGMADESVDQSAMPGEYVANMEFDTRRKIPDVRRDGAGTINGLRYVQRSMYMNRLNILKGKAAAGMNAFFDFDMRNDTTPAFITDLGANLDTQDFPMTLGFVSREYGRPRVTGTPNLAGMPELTYMAPMPWYDRDYSSPYELTMVPACSAARLSVEFDLGTETDFRVLDPNEDEVVKPFGHLLGFDFG